MNKEVKFVRGNIYARGQIRRACEGSRYRYKRKSIRRMGKCKEQGKEGRVGRKGGRKETRDERNEKKERRAWGRT